MRTSPAGPSQLEWETLGWAVRWEVTQVPVTVSSLVQELLVSQLSPPPQSVVPVLVCL